MGAAGEGDGVLQAVVAPEGALGGSAILSCFTHFTFVIPSFVCGDNSPSKFVVILNQKVCFNTIFPFYCSS